jgi:hypothetical protein
MPTIFGANTADPAYEISNSLRLNSGDTAYLKKTVGDGNRRKWTLSMWLKKTKIINNTEMYLWSSDDTGAGNAHDGAGFYSFGSVTGDNTSNSFHHQLGDAHGRIIASANARDTAAWYHMVWNVDTANSTAGDRMQLYVNGSRITDVVTSNNNPDQNFDTEFNRNNTENYLFADHHYGRYYFEGYVADVAFVDGQAYDASYFGKTDNNGVWIPIEPNVSSWGTNGFFLEFKQTGTSANSSGIGADTSGNDNHWTPVNTQSDGRHITTDTPTNNFCTLNDLTASSRATFSNGNTKLTLNLQGSVPYGQVEFGNFFVNTGKWYYEVFVVENGAGGQVAFGWNERYEDGNYTNGHNNLGSAGNVWYGGDGKFQDGSVSNTTAPNTYADSDIIGIALDLDNHKFYAHKNGTYQSNGSGTGDPSNGTNGFTVTSAYNDYWTPWISKDSDNASHNPTANFNFGNGINVPSSGNADANGYGNFEYAVPTGFYSLCTKNLAEYG